MDAYIAKPFRATQLITCIAQTMNIALKTVQRKENPAPMHYTKGTTDLAYLHKYCEGDEERMKNYIKIYLKAAAGFEEKASAAKDTEGVASLAHAFKPKWIMMGMTKSTELCTKIEALRGEPGHEEIMKEYLAVLVEQNSLSFGELKLRLMEMG